LKFAFELIRAEVYDRNVMLRHEIEKLLATKVEQLSCLSLGELVFPEEVHYERLFNSLLYLPSLELRKYLVRQFQI